MICKGFVKVKIGGLRSEKDVETVSLSGADAAGFAVGQVHTSASFILPSTARRLAAMLPVFVTPVLVTHLTQTGEILDLIDQTNIFTVQLHGGCSPETLAELRETAKEVRFIAVRNILSGTPSDLPADAEENAGALLLDTAFPEERRIDSTGRTHDWNISAALAEKCTLPVILAGGLSPENVQDAIRKVRPYAVDANTLLRTSDGELDPCLTTEFVKRVRGFSIEPA